MSRVIAPEPGTAAARTVAAIFESQVRLTPDRIAVRDDREDVTYAEVSVRANRLARRLVRHGIGPERRVALLMEQSVDMVVASLGVVKAGGAYVPLDPDWPEVRIEATLSDCAADVLVTSHRSSRSDARHRVTIALRDDGPGLDSESSADLEVPSQPEQLFSVVYTSGTSGAPKGALIPVRAVLNRLTWMWETSPYRSTDVSLLYRTHGAIGFTWDCFGPLLTGVPIVIAPAARMRDARALVETCVRRGISHVMATPSRWNAVLDYVERHRVQWRSLRVARSSGEPLPADTVARCRRVFPHLSLVNTYGASECSTTAVYDTSDHRAGGRVPAGTALPNVSLHVLDDRLRPVSTGQPGELCVAGACVARGYLNRPALTAERFVPDPYTATPGRRMFRTGDTGVRCSDGTVEIHGRRDRQVKIRGYRVELDEVEAGLRTCEGVRAAAVAADDHGPGDTRLVAYVVMNADADWSVQRIRSLLLERVPDYMVPSAFWRLREMPLTPSGKVDRLALRPDETPVMQPAPVPHETVISCTPAEDTLVAIWREVLERDVVGIDDDFFELGGDSLLAMQVQARVFDVFSVDVPLERLFAEPTIRALAVAMLKPENS